MLSFLGLNYFEKLIESELLSDYIVSIFLTNLFFLKVLIVVSLIVVKKAETRFNQVYQKHLNKTQATLPNIGYYFILFIPVVGEIYFLFFGFLYHKQFNFLIKQISTVYKVDINPDHFKYINHYLRNSIILAILGLFYYFVFSMNYFQDNVISVDLSSTILNDILRNHEVYLSATIFTYVFFSSEFAISNFVIKYNIRKMLKKEKETINILSHS